MIGETDLLFSLRNRTEANAKGVVFGNHIFWSKTQPFTSVVGYD